MVAGMNRALASVAAMLAILPHGCPKIELQFEDPKPEPFELQINVVSDPGVPLPGAQLIIGGNTQTTTDANGSAHVLSYGHEGDRIDVVVKCPEDYQSPDAPFSIGLRRLSKGSPIPHFEVRCPPTRRTVVVGFRVENGPNLPVRYLGRAIAHTDASGAALFTMRLKPATQVELSLDTSESGDGLRPQDPKFTFLSTASDDFVVFDQTFIVKKKPVVVVHQGPVGPKPL